MQSILLSDLSFGGFNMLNYFWMPNLAAGSHNHASHLSINMSLRVPNCTHLALRDIINSLADAQRKD